MVISSLKNSLYLGCLLFIGCYNHHECEPPQISHLPNIKIKNNSSINFENAEVDVFRNQVIVNRGKMNLVGTTTNVKQSFSWTFENPNFIVMDSDSIIIRHGSRKLIKINNIKRIGLKTNFGNPCIIEFYVNNHRFYDNDTKEYIEIF